MEHKSVLKEESIEMMNLREGSVAVDATLGLGGHSLLISEKIGESGHLYTFEQDERNLKEAKERLKQHSNQITYFHENFRHLKTSITGAGTSYVDAILFDLGLSSPHVDEADRGFSFLKEGPLDMRYDQRGKLTAESVINNYREEDLMKIFYQYGEDPYSKLIARKICEHRKANPFKTTMDLSLFLEAMVPAKKKMKIHPATKVFQALRIEVNNEMNVLKEALEQSVKILKVGGRIVIISYHSLEDTIVKHFFKDLEHPEEKDPEKMMYQVTGDPIVKAITKKPVVPSELEVKENPRSRSAKLRAYEKLRELPS